MKGLQSVILEVRRNSLSESNKKHPGMINVQIFDLPLLEPSSHLILIGTTSLGGPWDGNDVTIPRAGLCVDRCVKGKSQL